MLQSPSFPFASGESHLERKHPHIVERLRMLWGYPEGGRYLAGLLVDTRGGRAGFSPEVFAELLTISNRFPSLPLAGASTDRTVPARRTFTGFGDVHDESRRRLAAV